MSNEREFLKKLIEDIRPLDQNAIDLARSHQSILTKPAGSLGKLETLSEQLAGISGDPFGTVDPAAVIVFAADHGVAWSQGVSAYPPEVTGQMLLNYASGGAVVCVLARQARITVKAVDVGVKTDLPDASGYISKRVRCGTDDWSEKQAMSEEDALAAIMVGADIVHSEAQNGVKLLGFGEMGIGNTATSSALLCALTGVSPADATGKGTGLDDAGLARKTDVIRMGLSLHAEVIKKGDPISILSALGGLEIAAMAGAYIACAAYRIPVIVDGFICSVSALLASRISPFVKPFLIASHKSVEIGHRVALSELGLTPYLDCEMRLGEGSGAALMIPIVRSALAVLKETATFDEAGVADRG